MDNKFKASQVILNQISLNGSLELVANGILSVEFSQRNANICIMSEDEKSSLTQTVIREKFGYAEKYDEHIAFFDAYEWGSKLFTLSLQFSSKLDFDKFIRFLQTNFGEQNNFLIDSLKRAINERDSEMVNNDITVNNEKCITHGDSGFTFKKLKGYQDRNSEYPVYNEMDHDVNYYSHSHYHEDLPSHEAIQNSINEEQSLGDEVHLEQTTESDKDDETGTLVGILRNDDSENEQESFVSDTANYEIVSSDSTPESE